MLFSFLCDECGSEWHDIHHVGIGETHPTSSCPLCDGTMRRCVSQVNVMPGMQPHWNAAVGRPISSDAQFRSELSRKSDELSERTGADHKFVPVDMNDKKALGVTDEGLDTTARRRRESGMDAPTRKIIV